MTHPLHDGDQNDNCADKGADNGKDGSAKGDVAAIGHVDRYPGNQPDRDSYGDPYQGLHRAVPAPRSTRRAIDQRCTSEGPS